MCKHTEISSSRLPLVFLQEAFQVPTAGEHQLEAMSDADEGPCAVKIQSSPGATRRTSVGFDGVVVLLPWAKAAFFFFFF